MILRVSRVRTSLVALVCATGALNVPSLAIAGSISPAQLDSAAPAASAHDFGSPIEQPLTLVETSGSGLDLVASFSANFGVSEPQVAVPLTLSPESSFGTPSESPAGATYLTAATHPLTVSDVPEPTTLGLLLLGIAGLFAARRIVRKG